MTPEQALQSIGLTEKETKIYLSSLELGQDSVTHIAKKSGIKRPTVYLILESLQARGLINTLTKGKKTLYGAEEPQKLLSVVAEKQRALQTVLPFLEALNNRRTTKPKVRFYEGKEGILRIYEEMFETKEMRFWGSVEEVQKYFPEIVQWFEQLSYKNKPKIFDILPDTPANRAYARRVVRAGCQIRFFPPSATLKIDSMLAGNKLSLNAFFPEPHGLIIESEAITQSFKALWELAWQAAIPYEKLIKKRKSDVEV